MSLLSRILRFLSDRRGNTAVLAAFMIPTLVLSMGATVDYMAAAHREERLNGIADAAALAAVTPAMMLQSSTPDQTSAPYLAAYRVFNSQKNTVGNLGNITPNVSIVETSNGANVIRTATVSWTANSNNQFAGVLGLGSLPISGKAVAKSTLSPRTNFYLMIDTSPSMEIPSTTTGIQWMVDHTPSQGGCAFACHETGAASCAAAGDTNGNPVIAGYPCGIDNYQLSRQGCISLRIDLVNDAVNNLIQVAPATASVNKTVYGIQVNTFDVGFQQIFPVPPQVGPVTDFSTVTSSGFTQDGGCTTTPIPNFITITPMAMWTNNNPTPTWNNNDEDTHFDDALIAMNNLMPDPGNGTSNSTDTPKEVMFIVSDAVPDYDNGGRKYVPINVATNAEGVDYCTVIKNRKIRIAFLYLTYNRLPPTGGNSWYTTYIDPYWDEIEPAAQACASPGLFFQVDTDGDITSALNALFQKAVATSYLSQ